MGRHPAKDGVWGYEDAREAGVRALVRVRSIAAEPGDNVLQRVPSVRPPARWRRGSLAWLAEAKRVGGRISVDGTAAAHFRQPDRTQAPGQFLSCLAVLEVDVHV